MYNNMTKWDLKTIIISLILAVACYACTVYIIPMLFVDTQVQLFFSTIVATIGAAFLVNFLWELFAKRRFAESIFAVAEISRNIKQSGVDHIDTDFINIDWRTELSRTHSITAIVTYARTWRHANNSALEQFAKSKDNKFTVILPNCEDENIMAEFDRRYNYNSGETRKAIEEAIKEFSHMGADIYLYKGSLQATYYVMDNVAIMAFFKHSQGRGPVPYIRAESTGKFYDYIEKEKDAILKASTRIQVTDGGLEGVGATRKEQ